MMRAGWAAVLAALLAVLALAEPARAVEPDEILRDPALEARARALSLELRCLVCQNQSIDDSNAPLARDLRLIVRERLTAGDSDEQVRSYLVDRYGTFVLLRPPVDARTILLWATPALLLMITGVLIWRRLAVPRSAAPANAAPLSPDEEARVRAILEAGDRPPDRAPPRG